MVCLLFTLLALVAATKASSIESAFKTTCTVPNTTTHFVSSPDTRGSLDILWSCLFTIIACTLTIQHLNVPEQREGRDPGWRGDLRWTLKDTWRSLKWMFITILAPEVLIAKAAQDAQHARFNQVELKRLAQEDGIPWTLTHTLFANMGGFVIRRAEENNPHSIPETGVTPSSSSQDLLPNPYHLMAVDIIKLRESGKLSKLPYITTEEINDKSKANIFIKAIAITQILWMVVQILLRTARKLAVTQIEISVLAFSVCAIIIYFLYWQKPKDVKAPYTLMVLPTESLNSTIHSLWPPRQEGTEVGSLEPVYQTIASEMYLSRKRVRLGQPIPNDYSPTFPDISLDDPSFHFLVGIMIGCFVFAGIHVAAWDFHFPTMVDAIFWRVASMFCLTFPLLYYLAIVVIETFVNLLPLKVATQEKIDSIFMQPLVYLYILGRLILLVEIFRTLSFLPPDAFVTTSASNIPHVS